MLAILRRPLGFHSHLMKSSSFQQKSLNYFHSFLFWRRLSFFFFFEVNKNSSIYLVRQSTLPKSQGAIWMTLIWMTDAIQPSSTKRTMHYSYVMDGKPVVFCQTNVLWQVSEPSINVINEGRVIAIDTPFITVEKHLIVFNLNLLLPTRKLITKLLVILVILTDWSVF